MDLITQAMFQRSYLKLEVILNLYSYLVVCQQTNNIISQRDLRAAMMLCLGAHKISENDISIYSTLMLETCLDAKISQQGNGSDSSHA